MPRCGCGSGTCSCNIDATQSVGIDIGGDGSSTDPWTFSVDRDSIDLAGVIAFQPSTTVEFTQQGAGSAVSPLTVYADAKVSMSELTDVQDPEGAPTEGQVPTWVTDHWEFKTPATGGGATVVTSGGIQGDGSTGSPVRLRNSGVWPVLGFAAGQVASTGQPVYVDESGLVRAQPGYITPSKPVTDLLPTYPPGTSVMTVLAPDSAPWPAGSACVVVTHLGSGGVGSQVCYLTSATVTKTWVRSGTSTAWAPWSQGIEDTGWVTVTPISGTGDFAYRARGGVVSFRCGLAGVTSIAAGASGSLLAGGVLPAAYIPGVSVYTMANLGGSSVGQGVINSGSGSVSMWNSSSGATTTARFQATWLKE